MQQVSEYLDQMKKSSASFTSPAPIRIQQGSTSIWIRSKDSSFIQLSLPPPLPPPPSLQEIPVPSVEQLLSSPLLSLSRPLSLSPFILDPEASPKEYKMLRGSNSVLQLWTEWTLELAGGLSIEALDHCWKARWRTSSSEAMFYSRRRKIIKEIQKRVRDGTARDERKAINQLEQLQGIRSLDWLCKNKISCI